MAIPIVKINVMLTTKDEQELRAEIRKSFNNGCCDVPAYADVIGVVQDDGVFVLVNGETVDMKDIDIETAKRMAIEQIAESAESNG